jgi:hypothetical protein
MIITGQRYRFLREKLPDSIRRRVVVLTGARQTGKTTLVRDVYSDLEYVNLDAPENREAMQLVSTATWSESVGDAVIDEAQKLPEVFEKVKYAFDDRKITFTCLTGSSQILLLKKIRESLAGRAFFHELWPLLQSEINLPSETEKTWPSLICRILADEPLESVFSDIPPVLLEKRDVRLRMAEDHILQWGGMPALLPLKDSEREEWLKNYGYTYLERDLGDLARLDDLSPFRQFQRLAAIRSSSLVNFSELARDAGISVDTSRRYFEYLRLSYQTFFLEPYYQNLSSKVIKTPKLYWLDMGILRQLTGIRGLISGELYETMVVSEIYKILKTFQLDAELYFYRTRSGMELDLLIETPSGLVGVEMKSREQVYGQDLRVMRDLARILGPTWRGGIVVYRGSEIRKLDDSGIWMVPSRRLFQEPL